MALRNIPAVGLLSDRYLNPIDEGNQVCHFTQNNSGAAAFIMLAPDEQIDSVGIPIETADSTVSVVVGVEEVSSGTQGNPAGSYAPGIGGDAKSAVVSGASIPGPGLVWVPLEHPYRNTSGQSKIVALTVRTYGTGYTVHDAVLFSLALSPQFKGQFFPYVATYANGGSWSPSAGIPLLAARNAEGNLVGGTTGILKWDDALSWDNTATSDLYRGNQWAVESGCRMTAVSFSYSPDDDADVKLRVYVNGSLVASPEFAELNISPISTDLATCASVVTVPITPTVLEVGDVVRMVLEPTTANEIWTLPRLKFASSSDRLAFTRGVDIQYTEGSSTPTWNDDDEFIACIFPVIDQVHFSGGVNIGGSVGTTGAKFSVRSGKSEFIAQVFIPDASSASGEGLTGLTHASGGLRAYYMRSNASAPVGFNSGGTAGTLVTMTAGTWTDSGFVEIDDENMPGWYQVGIPNEAFEPGADSVSVLLRGAPNMPPINIDIAIDQEVTLAPRGFDNLGAPTFINSLEAVVHEPVSTDLESLTWPERLWFASQWVVGGRVDNRDLKQLSILGNDNSTPKGVAEYTDVGGIVTVNNMDLT